MAEKYERLLFGTAGTPRSSKAPTTQSGIERVKELGLDCMEIEFVQGVRMSVATAGLVGQVVKNTGIAVSAHAPYWINLNAHESDKLSASQQRVLQTARIGALCGVRNAIFHPAFYMGDSPAEAYERVKKCLQEVTSILKAEANPVTLRIELMGKPTQFGDLDEILNLSAEIEGVGPCIDFAHWHARTGRNNSYDEFVVTFRRIEERLGKEALDTIQIHVSGIEFSSKGERRHLNLRDSDFKYTEFVRALKDLDIKGMIICESPNLEGDALLLQETYNSL
ncbi:MAG: TIM barrel protein [Chloroflexi bacterium]|nr:TIM barrel protein [Chloroflexota bacterium]